MPEEDKTHNNEQKNNIMRREAENFSQCTIKLVIQTVTDPTPKLKFLSKIMDYEDNGAEDYGMEDYEDNYEMEPV